MQTPLRRAVDFIPVLCNVYENDYALNLNKTWQIVFHYFWLQHKKKLFHKMGKNVPFRAIKWEFFFADSRCNWKLHIFNIYPVLKENISWERKI